MPLAMPSLIPAHDDSIENELYDEYMEVYEDLLAAATTCGRGRRRRDTPDTIRAIKHELDRKDCDLQRYARLLSKERAMRFEAARESAARISDQYVPTVMCRDVYANGFSVTIINQAALC